MQGLAFLALVEHDLALEEAALVQQAVDDALGELILILLEAAALAEAFGPRDVVGDGLTLSDLNASMLFSDAGACGRGARRGHGRLTLDADRDAPAFAEGELLVLGRPLEIDLVVAPHLEHDAPVEGAVAKFTWKDVDQPQETVKPLQFWMRQL